ncbi:MAG: glycosyltransferase [Lachnospiraceae bacterium]|nr:glycosyltransferase [Lachnospiraceae bacterium]
MEELRKLPKIAVLMSSYNGGLYIKEQIDSILAQRDVDVYLFIRDDGSTDKTKEIIKRYLKLDNVFFQKGEENLGPGMSFLYLLYTVSKTGSYQYYAFADQDDVWKDEKLISAVKMLDDDKKPQLYCSNQIIYKNGEEKGLRFKEIPDLTLIGHMTRNDISGCTMLLNNTLVKEIVKHDCPKCDISNLRMHDTIVFLIALLIGEIKYDENAYILYRIHEDNTVGIKEKTLTDRISRALKKGLPYKNLRMKTAKFLIDNYTIDDEENRIIIEEFANYQSGIKNRLRLIKDKRLCENSGEKRWMFILKVFINYV